MHPYIATGAISAILVLAGTALSLTGTAHDELTHEAMELPMKGHGGGHGGGAHDWTGGTGTIPTSSSGLDRLDDITIGADKDFNPANGVRSGSGTFEDPFVISGWNIKTLYIHDTTKAFEIKENWVSGILVLDWTGQGGYVHHNTINNLRTNRNVARTGDPTAAVIEKNQIDEVEELRHFDGVVANNTIGVEPVSLLDLSGVPTPGRVGQALGALADGDGVVLNIAGLNGAGIHDNKIYGGVDMKIHGHHHSDTDGAHSHNHGQPDAQQGEDHLEDHQVRYVDFLFYKNTIKDEGFGLRYNDLAHAGDDRTATSEQEPDLEKAHVHHTRVTIMDNVIDGATLRFAIVNAEDERHLSGESADITLQNNRVLKPAAGDGIVLQDVRNAHVYVLDNKVEKGDVQVAGQSGILLQRFRSSEIHVAGNALGDYKYGIRASEFDANTNWTVGKNSAPGSEYPVYWDNSVPNAPQTMDGEQPTHAEGHGHTEAPEAAPAMAGTSLRRVALG